MSNSKARKARRKLERREHRLSTGWASLVRLEEMGKLEPMTEPSDTRDTDIIAKEKWDANKSRTPTPRLQREAARAMWQRWMSEQEIE